MNIVIFLPETCYSKWGQFDLSLKLLRLGIGVSNKTRFVARMCSNKSQLLEMGAQLLSGRVLDSRPKGRRFEPHRRHCVVVLEQDTFILA